MPQVTMGPGLRSGVARSVVAVSFLISMAAPRVLGSEHWVQGVDARLPFRVEFPSSWYRLDPWATSFDIVNFHPSRRVKAVVLPDGGAEIVILLRPPAVQNLDEWIRTSRKGLTPTNRHSLRVTDAATGTDLNVLEIGYKRPQLPKPVFESLDCYFTKSGLDFAARLTYWEGDPRSEEYRRVLHEVVRRIEVRENRSGPQ